MNALQMFDGAHVGVMNMRLFVKAAATAGFNLFLTGSRYFGGATEESDWDFFTDNNIIDWLEEHGFHEEHALTYPDTQTVKVFCGIIAGYSVHVQLVKAVEIKMAAQRAIKKTNALTIAKAYGPKTDLNKRILRSAIWNLAIEAVSG